MIQMYERPIFETFAGDGDEIVVVCDGQIVVHTRVWDTPGVQDDFRGGLVGRPESCLTQQHRRPWKRSSMDPDNIAWAHELIEE